MAAIIAAFASMACIAAQGAHAETMPSPEVDWWEYSSAGILYNGTPIHIVRKEGQEGGFDRPIRWSPPHRVVFLDAKLSLAEAAGIVSFWGVMDPKTKTDFIVISDNDEIEFLFPRTFERKALPPGLLELARRSLRGTIP